MQAIAQLAAMFPSLPSSALAETLCKSSGDVQRAAEALLEDGVAKSPMDLLKAAQEGDTATVKALLLAGADAHCKDANGYGLEPNRASFADRAGRGVDASRHRTEGIGLHSWTALHAASQNGHTELVKALLSAGTDVHSKDSTHRYARGLHHHRQPCFWLLF